MYIQYTLFIPQTANLCALACTHVVSVLYVLIYFSHVHCLQDKGRSQMMKGHFHVRKKVNWRTEIQDMTLINSKEVRMYVHTYIRIPICMYMHTCVHIVFNDCLVPRTQREIERS